MKLTKAQMELLRELPTNCVSYYKPAVKLVELGLAKWPSSGSRLEITEAGRSALRDGGWE